LLPNIDGRSATARRYRDIVAALVCDQGGSEHMSEARAQLSRRFAALAVQAEAMEARLARGEAIDLQEHALIASTLVRLAQRIGIDRHARDLTPTLQEYLAVRAAGERRTGSSEEEPGPELALTETRTGDSPTADGEAAT
jgi:hypothetical protein